MNTLSDEQLKELERLYQKATPGPWPDPDTAADMEISDEEMEHNMRLVYALHNAFPALLSTIQSLRAELAAAKEREQGCHQAVRKHLSDFADSEYVRGCNLLRRAECLGWEAKAKTGKFGEAEMNAHKAANMAFGAYEGIHAALRHLPTLPQPPTKGGEV